MSLEKAPWFLSRVISRAFPEDPQAVVTLAATTVLLGSLVALVSGIVHQLWALHDIGWGTVGALVVLIAGPCTLAHVKAPSMPVGVAAPPAASGSSSQGLIASASGSAKIEAQP